MESSYIIILILMGVPPLLGSGLQRPPALCECSMASGYGPPTEWFIIIITIALQGAAAASQAGSAKLMRFAAALRLDARHQQALLQSSIARNMAIGNYRWPFLASLFLHPGWTFLWVHVPAAGRVCYACMCMLMTAQSGRVGCVAEGRRPHACAGMQQRSWRR